MRERRKVRTCKHVYLASLEHECALRKTCTHLGTQLPRQWSFL